MFCGFCREYRPELLVLLKYGVLLIGTFYVERFITWNTKNGLEAANRKSKMRYLFKFEYLWGFLLLPLVKSMWLNNEMRGCYSNNALINDVDSTGSGLIDPAAAAAASALQLLILL